MHLHTLKSAKGSRKPKRRVGRGVGSGRGVFSTRGVKGQSSRAGSRKKPQFEGGQTPLIRRQPKLQGFKNPNRVEFEVINLSDLEAKLEPGEYTVEALVASRVAVGNKPVKLLGSGSVTKKFALTLDAASKTARAAIEKAGGSVTIA